MADSGRGSDNRLTSRCLQTGYTNETGFYIRGKEVKLNMVEKEIIRISHI